MTNTFGFDPELFNWVILPLLIFLARVMDVTLGTMRIIFLSRGKRYLAPVFGFVEVLIWIIAIGQIVQNLTNPACYLAYAAGFAAGNFIGMSIEEKLALGTLAIRIFVLKDAQLLAERLHEAGYGVTSTDAQGSSGPVKVIFTVIKRKDLVEAVALIRSVNPKAFFSIEEIRSASEGVFPATKSRLSRRWFSGHKLKK